MFLVGQASTCYCCYLFQFIILLRNSYGGTAPADFGDLRNCSCSSFVLFHLYSLLLKSVKHNCSHSSVCTVFFLTEAFGLFPMHLLAEDSGRRIHTWRHLCWVHRPVCFIWWIHSSQLTFPQVSYLSVFSSVLQHTVFRWWRQNHIHLFM